MIVTAPTGPKTCLKPCPVDAPADWEKSSQLRPRVLNSEPDWKGSRHNTPLRSPPVARCDEALRNNYSLCLLGSAPPPGWHRHPGLEAHGGHYSLHGGALTPSPLTSPPLSKSAWQQQPQQ